MNKSIIFFLIPCLIGGITSCKETKIVNSFIYYKVDDSCLNMGKIEGVVRQNPLVGDYTSEVVAVPKEGFKFIKWSDDYLNPNRSDMATEDFFVTYVAFFEVVNE